MTVTAESIRFAYEAETDHDRPVTALDEILGTYEAITPECRCAAISR